MSSTGNTYRSRPVIWTFAFFKSCKNLALEETRNTPYWPQSDGMVERLDLLSAFVNENRYDWDEHLSYIMMGYRGTLNKSTNCSPNLLMMDWEVSLPNDIMMGFPPNTPDDKCPVMYIEWLKYTVRNALDFSYKHL